MGLVVSTSHFSTSQVPKTPKTVRCWRVLYILTSKSAFHHSRAQFCRIRCLKSAPKLPCFVHFHFKMRLSPQRRAFFRHQNFQKCPRNAMVCTFSLPNVPFATGACIFSTSARTKCSEDYSFLTFSLPNALFATAAYNFSTSELPKVVPDRQFFSIFTSECAFRHSGVQFFRIWTS